MIFSEQVICLVRAIPAGHVLTYGGVAAHLEKPRHARAVGYALNQLPFGTDVPWQRVVGKHGDQGKISLRSFSYSRDEQIARLKAEGLAFNPLQRFPLADYLWRPAPAEVAAILAEGTD